MMMMSFLGEAGQFVTPPPPPPPLSNLIENRVDSKIIAFAVVDKIISKLQLTYSKSGSGLQYELEKATSIQNELQNFLELLVENNYSYCELEIMICRLIEDKIEIDWMPKPIAVVYPFS